MTQNLLAPFEQLLATPLNSFHFSDSTEITLVSLDLHIQFIARKLRGYEKSHSHVETNDRVGLDTNNLGSKSGRSLSYKVI